MNYMLSVFAFTVTLAACSQSSDSNKVEKKTINPNEKSQITKLGAYEFDLDKARKLSAATLSSLTYDGAKHALALTLNYQGCKPATHSLLFSEACAESYPRQCGAVLTLAGDYDESCSTAQEEKLSLPLADSQDEMVLSVANKSSKTLSVLIDRTGKVKAATTPP